jgi:Ca2+-binding RTX toxin-like protein
MNRPRRSHAFLAAFVAAAALTPPALAAADEPPRCAGVPATIWGTDGADVLEGTSGDDVLAALGGPDVVNGNGGDDLICGGAGRDTISGGDGADVVWAQGGNDIVRGGRGDDLIRAGRGNDRSWGNGGSDEVRGATGADVCVAEVETSCELDRRFGHTPEAWFDMVDEYFGDIGETDNAMVIMACESNGEPFVVGGGGTEFYGLFQHATGDWERRAEGAGFSRESPFHPEANIAAARWYSDEWVAWKSDPATRWDAWSCSREL